MMMKYYGAREKERERQKRKVQNELLSALWEERNATCVTREVLYCDSSTKHKDSLFNSFAKNRPYTVHTNRRFIYA